MSHSFLRCFLILLTIALASGCSHYQPTKEVWKTTKGLWGTYVSPPANVDYDEKGDLPPQALELSKDMMGVDAELSKLERAMQNADKPPTQEWLDKLFATFPWLDGFAGVKYNGVILGQQPPESLKELDFNPLLYEDAKQNSRALRADIQPSPLGPEIMLATPLYDGIDFLGIVVAYFDMRSLMKFSENASNMVVLAPTALLWPGKYDFASTPLAGVNWSEVVTKSTSGTCSNANGSFFYLVRYLGNLPLIFAVPEKGDFAEGNGGLEQGQAYFPQSREKIPPPDLPERKPRKEAAEVPFAQPEDGGQPQLEQNEMEQSAPEVDNRPSPNEIQPGSRESMLLKGGRKGSAGEIQERQLEGENVEVERVQRPRVPRRTLPPLIIEEPEDIIPEPPQPAVRPSPFGPREESPEETRQEFERPSPFGPREEKPASSVNEERLADGEPADSAAQQETRPEPEKQSAPAAKTDENASGSADGDRLADGEPANPAVEDEKPRQPARMRDGRPSPFGPTD